MKSQGLFSDLSRERRHLSKGLIVIPGAGRILKSPMPLSYFLRLFDSAGLRFSERHMVRGRLYLDILPGPL